MKIALVVFVILPAVTFIKSATMSDLENGTYVRVASIFFTICAVISLLILVLK
ncbi:hypothetical protein QN386_01965 [Pseudomonas sp. CCI3.2]|uniref:hypothetical protein n=1 Tax=unclassified Pseudomonas TaxID=196821 RepID=UPI002AC9933E|nr:MULTISPECIES: hypothetical protein [unclassified Pseudomonas]MEB0076103.1 hypothetical protein [Pseudomonas sp. MH10out]MEB0090791.1 hypothetical protein [Pseudomonas sp. CCI4.2]MEB0100097.1 hypothetical protein [Pseudomonas sp. CCI3.2]MEB0132058.1 hypothetical protein [Pseudomonas sp. CCI2.4]MEB0156144.1 hypothetical protein [Pseudomonas sp. AH2 (2023)]